MDVNLVLGEREADEGNFVDVLNDLCGETILKQMSFGTLGTNGRAIRKSQRTKDFHELNQSSVQTSGMCLSLKIRMKWRVRSSDSASVVADIINTLIQICVSRRSQVMYRVHYEKNEIDSEVRRVSAVEEELRRVRNGDGCELEMENDEDSPKKTVVRT